jgi:hypothetical protein
MDEATGRKIHAFNKEMEAAGVLMACGTHLTVFAIASP